MFQHETLHQKSLAKAIVVLNTVTASGMGRLDGKVALISGGVRGQGASEARLFAPEGVKVVIGDGEKRSVFGSHNSTRE